LEYYPQIILYLSFRNNPQISSPGPPVWSVKHIAEFSPATAIIIHNFDLTGA